MASEADNNLEGGKGEVPVLAAEKSDFICHKEKNLGLEKCRH